MMLEKLILKGRVIQQELFRSSKGNIANDPDFQPMKDEVAKLFPNELFNDLGHTWGVATPESTYLPNTIVAHNCINFTKNVPAGIIAHPNYDTMYNYTKMWDMTNGTISYNLWWNAINFGHDLIDELPIELNIRWFGINIDQDFNETGEVIISVQGLVSDINDYLISKAAVMLNLPEELNGDSSINIHYNELTGEVTEVMPFIQPNRFMIKGDPNVINHSWVDDFATNSVDSLTKVTKDSRGNVIGRTKFIMPKIRSYRLVKRGNGFVRVAT
jgi:hypothetical protein